MVRGRAGNAFLEVTLAARTRKCFAQRTRQLIARSRPIQTVLASWGARDLLSEVQQRIPLGIANVVFALRIDEREARLDRRELVRADATVDDFLYTGGAVESVTTVTLDDRERERPFIRADYERGYAFGIGLQGVRAGVRLQKSLARVLVLDRVARVQHRFGLLAEHLQQCAGFLGLHGRRERLCCRFGRCRNPSADSTGCTPFA